MKLILTITLLFSAMVVNAQPQRKSMKRKGTQMSQEQRTAQFSKVKEKMSKNLEERISQMTKMKDCVDEAKDQKELAKCRSLNRTKRHHSQRRDPKRRK